MKEEQTMDSSQLDPTKFNLRNKGIRTSNGRLHKGCVKDAFTKLSIGSIPSNYQSIIYKHEEKRGFGTTQKRFMKQNALSELIRSQIDNQSQCQEVVKKMHASHSTKGFGPLIAREKRQWRKYPKNPGPGQYFDPKTTCRTESKKRRTCFTRQRQDYKRKEIVHNKQNYIGPGPGDYELENKGDHAINGWRSAFVTKGNRQGYIQKSNSPGPGVYAPDQKSSPQKQKKRDIQEGQLYNKLSQQKQAKGKHFLARPQQPLVPGPGHYDHDIPNFKPLYQRIKISPNFIQNNRDRFDQSLQPSNQPSPKGPTACTYDIQSSFDKNQKKLIQMPAFMSESRRIVFQGSSNCSQIAYDSVIDPIKNYHFNITGKWI